MSQKRNHGQKEFHAQHIHYEELRFDMTRQEYQNMLDSIPPKDVTGKFGNTIAGSWRVTTIQR